MIEEITDSVTPVKAAQLLGVHVGTIHRWLTNGVRGRILPSVLVGGRRRILTAQLEAFLSANGRSAGDVNEKRDETTHRHQDAQNQLRSFGVRVAPDRRG